MPTPTSNLESHLGYWMRLVSNHVSHAFRLKLETRGVTVAEWVVLRALYDEDGLHPSQVAQTLGMTRGAISKLVDRLADKKLVAVKAGATDRRFQRVALSPSGRRLVPLLARLADQNDREFFGDLSDNAAASMLAELKGICERRGLKAAPVD